MLLFCLNIVFNDKKNKQGLSWDFHAEIFFNSELNF